MPIYQATDPQTGRKIELEGDSPPTEQELEEAFSSVQSSAAQAQGSAGSGVVAAPVQDISTRATRELPELFTSGILNGEDPGQVAKFTALAVVTPDELELGKIAMSLFPNIGFQQDEAGNVLLGNNRSGVRAVINTPGPSATDAAQFTGLGAAFAYPSRVGLEAGLSAKGAFPAVKGAAAAGGMQLGIEGAQAAGGGDLDLTNAALAGALQPAAQIGLRRATSPVTGRIGKTYTQDESGQITEQAIAKIDEIFKSGGSPDEINSAVANELQISGVLNPEQAKRFNLFAKRNVPPLRANVTQSTDDFRQLQDSVKRSGPVAERVAEQDERLFKIARDGIENIGPTTQNVVETNTALFKSIDDRVTELDNVVFEAYTKAREVAKGQPRITLDNLSKAISDSRGSENISGGVISAVRGVLKNKGALRTGVDIDINKRGARLTGEDTRKLTVTEAEEIRQNLNRFYESATPEGRRIIRELKNALDDDVADAVGDDIFKDARQAKINFQGVIERGRRNKFDKTKGSFLEDVIDNKIPEEKIVPRLLTGRDDDFIAFKRFLLNDSGPEGIQSFNNIKAQILRDSLDKAITQGKGEGGQAIFSGAGFRQSLQTLKQTKKYNELFNKDERELIDDIIEISRLRVPNRSVAQGSGPSGFAIEAAKNEVKREILKQIPIIGERAKAIVDAITGSSAARRQLDPLRETRTAVETTASQRFAQNELIPDIEAAIQSARQTGSSSPPTNF
jgi:hypothetical protein